MNKGDRYLRVLALKRDSGLCCNCGEKAKHAHHIVPLSIGGNDVLSNLVSLCVSCHRKIHVTEDLKMKNLIKAGREKKTIRENKKTVKTTILPEFEKLLTRFREGEFIFKNDIDLLKFHEVVKNYKGPLGFRCGQLPTGTLRNALKCYNWKIERNRWTIRDENRHHFYYTAHPLSIL
jgi:hypothetical protein